MKSKRRLFSLPEEVQSKLDDIRQKRFLRYDSDAIVYAILETHEREFNNYREIMKKRTPKVNLTDEQKLERKAQREEKKKEIEREMILNKGRAICDLLGGTEINHGNGNFGCEFNMYEKVGKRVLKGKRLVSLDLLTQEHIELQFRGGTKEEIMEILANE